MTQTIVVFVPGIMGSTLTAPHNALTVWPDQVVLHPSQALALLTQPDLSAGDVLGWITSKYDIYGGFIDYFITSCGYLSVNAGSTLPTTEKNVLVLQAYDWRLSNADSAAAVDATLRAVAAAYSGATIWLVAHSMGGLVSRYVLESGAFADPTYTVAGLITIATPHLGVPLALSAITGEVNTNNFLNPQIIEELVDFPQFTSTFQMLPPSTTFVFDANGDPFSIWATSSPVYQLLTSTSGFDAPAAGFAAATAFTSQLDFSSSQNGRPSYYLVYGSTLSTVQTFLYDSGGGSPQAQLASQQSTAGNGGDGTVPVWSASFPGGWATASLDAGALTHGQLPNDQGVLAQIGKWIAGS